MPVFVGFALTGMVPAAASGAASPPHPVELYGVPVAEAVVAQSVWSQVTDLQSRKLPQELTERQPAAWKQNVMLTRRWVEFFFKNTGLLSF